MPTEVFTELGERLRAFDIHLGAPIQYPEIGTLKVPENPHVFFCRELYLLQPEQEIARLQESVDSGNLSLVEVLVSEGEFEQAVFFGDVMVMLGHGLVLGEKENQWVFRGSRRSVSETVKVYEEVAKQINWPPLDLIIACRPRDDVDNQKQVRVTFRRRSIPYIYPDQTAHVLNTRQISSRLVLNEGAVLVTKAERWVDINRWLKYWAVYPRKSSVPEWAKLSAK